MLAVSGYWTISVSAIGALLHSHYKPFMISRDIFGKNLNIFLPKCWLYRVIEPFPFPPLAHCCIVITVVVGIEEHELAVDGDTEAKSWLTFTSRWFNELFWLNELFSRVLSTWFKVGEVFTATLKCFREGYNRIKRGFWNRFFIEYILKFFYSAGLITDIRI